MTKDSISWIIVNNSLKLTTKNLIRGNKFYNEKIVFSNDQEYRVWTPYRSKLAAAILNGIEILPIIEKSRVLYLGTSAVVTLSHISDIIGAEGVVYAVEHSHETAKELIEKLVQKIDNIKPIIMDMTKPSQYEIIDGKRTHVITPECEVTLKNLETGKEYMSDSEADHDVDNPNSNTKREHISRSVHIKVAAIDLGADSGKV